MAIPNVRLNEQGKVSKSPTLTVRPVHGPSNQNDCNTPIEDCVADASGFNMFARFNRFVNGFTSYPRDDSELATSDATPPLDFEEYQHIQSRNASHLKADSDKRTTKLGGEASASSSSSSLNSPPQYPPQIPDYVTNGSEFIRAMATQLRNFEDSAHVTLRQASSLAANSAKESAVVVENAKLILFHANAQHETKISNAHSAASDYVNHNKRPPTVGLFENMVISVPLGIFYK
jgi:hypothetical protein